MKRKKIEMHIEIKGNKNGKKVLLLPGMFQSADCFESLCDFMSEYCLVLVTYNSHDAQKREFKSFAHEMYTLENGLKKMHMTEFEMIAGFSMGGIMAVSLARRGRLTTKHVFVDNLKTCKPLFRRAVYCYEVIGNRLFSLWAKSPFRKKLLFSKQYTEDWASKMQRNAGYMSFSSVKNMTWDMVRFTLPKELELPIHYFYGDGDNKAYVRNLFKLYPDASVVIKKGYENLSYLDQHPVEYAMMLKDYMKAES